MNRIYKELLKIINLPTPHANYLKDIGISFDEVFEKIENLPPELRQESGILLAQAIINHKILNN